MLFASNKKKIIIKVFLILVVLLFNILKCACVLQFNYWSAEL